MSQIRHFPRYSQKENIVTNNVLLLMSRLYDYNRLKFSTFLVALGDEASNVAEHLQLQFGQQRGTETSVVDGFIAQESMKIVVETKLNEDDFYLYQLEGHLSAFDEESHRLLVLLSPGPTGPSGDVLEKIRNEGLSKGINTLHTTFEEVIAAAKSCLSDHDETMLSVVEDFAVFCSDEDLLPRDKFRMFTPPCGQSFDDNLEYSLYYCPVSWNRRSSQYLGIYAFKAVRLIGKISKIITCDLDVERDTVESEGEINDDEKKRIVDAARAAYNKRGWDISRDYKFFLCNEMVETDFQKTSPGGIQGHRYFDLGEILGLKELPRIHKLGEFLKNETWE